MMLMAKPIAAETATPAAQPVAKTPLPEPKAQQKPPVATAAAKPVVPAAKPPTTAAAKPAATVTAKPAATAAAKPALGVGGDQVDRRHGAAELVLDPLPDGPGGGRRHLLADDDPGQGLKTVCGSGRAALRDHGGIDLGDQPGDALALGSDPGLVRLVSCEDLGRQARADGRRQPLDEEPRLVLLGLVAEADPEAELGVVLEQ